MKKLFTIFLLLPYNLFSQKTILSIELGLDQVKKWDYSNGDTYDPFWAFDDSLYAFGCDGRGFGPRGKGRNINFNKLSGESFQTLTGTPVNSMDEYGRTGQSRADSANWKVCGQESIDSVFYTFVSRNIYGNKSKDRLMRQTAFNASLIKSTDKGKTWQPNEYQSFASPMWHGPYFSSPFFVHYGKNGGNIKKDLADTYIYAISNNGFWNGGDSYIIGRILRKSLPQLSPSDWAYYIGGNGTDNKSWQPDITKAAHLLDLPAQCGQGAATYIPSLKKYLLVAWYITDTLKRWFNPKDINYDFYQAEHPWGPYTKVQSFSDNIMEGGHWYGPSLLTKFQQPNSDGVTVYMVTSGCPPFKDTLTSLYKMWGMPVFIKTKESPITQTIDDSDPSILYSPNWKTLSEPKSHDINKALHLSDHSQDSIIFRFKGRGVDIICPKIDSLGTFAVYIDNKFQTTVSLSTPNFPRISQVRVWGTNSLKKGSHILKVVNQSDRPICIDGFKLYALK